MKYGFLFTQIKKYDSPLPKQEAMARVRKALAEDCVVNTTPIRVSEDALSFFVKRFNIIYISEERNLYLDVTVQFRKTKTGTEVQTICRPHPAIRVINCLIMILMVFLELFCCFIRLLDQKMDPHWFLIPILFFVIIGLTGFLSLRFSSRDVIDVIHAALYVASGSEQI